MPITALELKAQAAALGFDLAGVTPARPALRLDAYLRWVEAGMHGEMAYLARDDRLARRRDLNAILPGARSLVMVGLGYHTPRPPEAVLTDPSRGRIAAYAWGRDYHDVMLPRLEALAGWLGEHAPQASRPYVDTGAILERDHAWQAGLGFVGKNTMLIHPRRGSGFFLGALLTTAEFDEYDRPRPETLCGSCTRCLSACPTGAFRQPYVLDARICISYLTIEHKGWIPRELRPRMGNWVFGCDVCREVCPWERFAAPTPEAVFYPVDVDRAAPRLADLLALDAAAFAARFGGTPVARIGRERLVRNACIAAGNSRSPDLTSNLQLLILDPSSLVRGHAGWALARLGGARAADKLRNRLTSEPDEQVRAEFDLSIEGGQGTN
jgi:epoxyqueuosine reductase